MSAVKIWIAPGPKRTPSAAGGRHGENAVPAQHDHSVAAARLAGLLGVKHVHKEQAKVALQPEHVAAAAVHHLKRGRGEGGQGSVGAQSKWDAEHWGQAGGTGIAMEVWDVWGDGG